MGDRFIVTSHSFVQHNSLEKAEKERARLAAKAPEKTFSVLRIKTTVAPSGGYQEMLGALKSLAAFLAKKEVANVLLIHAECEWANAADELKAASAVIEKASQ